MGLRVYKVRLYRTLENRLKNDFNISGELKGTNFDYEYACDIFVMETSHGIVEIATNYKLITQRQLSNIVDYNYRNKFKSNKPLCKYIIFDSDIIDDNLVSIQEVDNYLSNMDTEWFIIYNNEIEKASSDIQKKTLKIARKLIGTKK